MAKIIHHGRTTTNVRATSPRGWPTIMETTRRQTLERSAAQPTIDAVNRATIAAMDRRAREQATQRAADTRARIASLLGPRPTGGGS